MSLKPFICILIFPSLLLLQLCSVAVYSPGLKLHHLEPRGSQLYQSPRVNCEQCLSRSKITGVNNSLWRLLHSSCRKKNIYSNCSITYGLYIILKTVLTLGDNAFWVLLNWLMFMRCNFAASSHYCYTFEGWWWVSLSQGIGRGKCRWGRDGVAQVFQPFA